MHAHSLGNVVQLGPCFGPLKPLFAMFSNHTLYLAPTFRRGQVTCNRVRGQRGGRRIRPKRRVQMFVHPLGKPLCLFPPCKHGRFFVVLDVGARASARTPLPCPLGTQRRHGSHRFAHLVPCPTELSRHVLTHRFGGQSFRVQGSKRKRRLPHGRRKCMWIHTMIRRVAPLQVERKLRECWVPIHNGIAQQRPKLRHGHRRVHGDTLLDTLAFRAGLGFQKRAPRKRPSRP